jgi:hypothetical protein
MVIGNPSDEGGHMNIRKLILTALATSLTVSLIAMPDVAGASSTGTPVDGVWRSDGYASVLAISNGRASLYETTSISCAAGPVATQAGKAAGDGTVRFAAKDLAFTARVEHHRTRLVLHMDGSAGDRHLRRLQGLPGSCTRPGPTGPLATFDLFWQTYAENYPFFAAKGIDWPAVRDRYRPRVRPDMTDKELFDLLAEVIEPLGDAHTGIRIGEGQPGEPQYVGHRPGTTFPTLELEQKVRPFIERRDLHGPLQEFGNGRIGYTDLPGRIGYLRIIAFAGYTNPATYATDSAELDRALNAILTPARTSGPAALRGLVIDLRVNGGGHDALGLQLASRLTRQPYLAYSKRARNDANDPDRFTRPQPVRVPATAAPVYSGPVVILTGGSAMSAGETFTLATFGRSPRPVRIGENTQGVFSDTLIRSLPNGWHFILPNEEFLTREGRTFDGTGIPPDLRTPVFTDEEFAADRDSAFDQAIGLLSRR